MRLSVTVSEEVNMKLDMLTKKWGVSKSNLCAMVLGQYVDGIDKVYDMLDKITMKGIERIGVEKS